MSDFNYYNTKIDLSSLPQGNFLGPGTHDCFIYEISGDGESAKGDRWIDYQFRSEENGKTHNERIMIEGGGAFRFFEMAVAAGFNPSDSISPGDLLQKKVRINLVKQEYNGKEYTRISSFEPINKPYPEKNNVQAPLKEEKFNDPF